MALRAAASGGTDPEARAGELTVDGQAYPVKRQDLPTVVECFKTYDHVNLVKCGDVGQVACQSSGPSRGRALLLPLSQLCFSMNRTSRSPFSWLPQDLLAGPEQAGRASVLRKPRVALCR